MIEDDVIELDNKPLPCNSIAAPPKPLPPELNPPRVEFLVFVIIECGVGHGSRFCVCSLVFMISRGFVNAAAIAPAKEP